jgi:hypothetical protein
MRASYVTWTLAALTAALLAAGCGGGSEERKLFEETARARCTKCHGPSRWEGKHFTAEEWKTILDRMIKNGAVLSDEEYKRLLVGPGK